MLIVLRGNSGSGKSTTARLLRDAALERRPDAKIAIVEQDYLRRYVLKEKDTATAANNIGLIQQTVSFALQYGYEVILEGILTAARYEPMLQQLAQASADSHFYYLHVSFAQTLIRHQSKPNAHEFGEQEMRTWYRRRDPLRFTQESIIPEASSQQQTIDRILTETGI